MARIPGVKDPGLFRELGQPNEMGVPPALPGRHAKFDNSGSMLFFADKARVRTRGLQLLVLTLSVAIRPL